MFHILSCHGHLFTTTWYGFLQYLKDEKYPLIAYIHFSCTQVESCLIDNYITYSWFYVKQQNNFILCVSISENYKRHIHMHCTSDWYECWVFSSVVFCLSFFNTKGPFKNTNNNIIQIKWWDFRKIKILGASFSLRTIYDQRFWLHLLIYVISSILIVTAASTTMNYLVVCYFVAMFNSNKHREICVHTYKCCMIFRRTETYTRLYKGYIIFINSQFVP